MSLGGEDYEEWKWAGDEAAQEEGQRKCRWRGGDLKTFNLKAIGLQAQTATVETRPEYSRHIFLQILARYVPELGGSARSPSSSSTLPPRAALTSLLGLVGYALAKLRLTRT